ncbi:MAG: hypothetical protein AAB540_00900, partial [Patescibacteria group bacterium]
MDKVDEWMKRTLEKREESSNTPSQTDTRPVPAKQGQFGKQKNLPQSSPRAQTHVQGSHNVPPKQGQFSKQIPAQNQQRTKQEYNKNNFKKMQ